MARDIFQMTVSQPDPVTGAMKALSGIGITVYKRGTTDIATIYQRPTGATQGPSPESGATGGPNPFGTGPSGSVEFWADGPLEYDIEIRDSITPARIPPRSGTGALGWNSSVAAVGSVPSSHLAADGGLTFGSLGPDIVRQVAQIGQVIDWWRPQTSVPIPNGWEICDGHSVPAGQHAFVGVAGAINVPDLRNAFILGADPTKPQAQQANLGNAVTDGPGIAGTGGSNAARDFNHTHTVPVPVHTHTVQMPDHYHLAGGGLTTGGHSHAGGTGYANRDRGWVATGSVGAGGETVPYLNHQHAVSTDAPGNLGVYGNVGYYSTAHGAYLSSTTSVANPALSTATAAPAWTTDPGTDVRPKFVGLLKLMKVRNT